MDEGKNTQSKLHDDTLALITEYEDEYRCYALLAERIEEKKVKLRQIIDMLTAVYRNVEELR